MSKAKTLQQHINERPAKEKQVYLQVRRVFQDNGFFQPEEWEKMQRTPIIGKEGYWVHSQQARNSKISFGHPDMFVCLAGLPFWLGIELKARKIGKRGGILKPVLTAEQKLLHSTNNIRVVQSTDQVEELIAEIQNTYRTIRGK